MGPGKEFAECCTIRRQQQHPAIWDLLEKKKSHIFLLQKNAQIFWFNCNLSKCKSAINWIFLVEMEEVLFVDVHVLCKFESGYERWRKPWMFSCSRPEGMARKLFTIEDSKPGVLEKMTTDWHSAVTLRNGKPLKTCWSILRDWRDTWHKINLFSWRVCFICEGFVSLVVVEDVWSMVKVVCMVKLLKQPVSQYVSFLSMFVLGRHGSRLLSVRIFDIMIANSVPTQHFDVINSLFTLIFTSIPFEFRVCFHPLCKEMLSARARCTMGFLFQVASSV